eukprot:Awhi_evm1s12514
MNTKSNSSLYQPLRIGDFTVANRVVMAPLTRSRATIDHIPTEIMTKYYRQRSSSGLIISEATNINQEAVGWYKSPGIWSEEQVQAWKPITEAVHSKGGRIVCQLWHTGRRGHSVLSKMPVVSASPIALSGHVHGPYGSHLEAEVPRALNEQEIKATVKDYGIAAKNAIEAGFDGVEIHGANGYLIDQFLQSCSNQREDKYGGSVENRLRFLEEVIDEVIRNIPKEKVGVRLSPHGNSGDMGSSDNVEQFNAAITLATQKGLSFIHLMDGVFFEKTDKIPPFTLAQTRAVADKVEREDRIVIIGNSGYDKAKAEARVAEGDAEMIAFGTLFISNPDLYERLAYDLEIAPVCDMKYWFFPIEGETEELGYTDFPFASRNLNTSSSCGQLLETPSSNSLLAVSS